MPLQQVDVKTYTRKGKLVKAYKRKQDKKNKLIKTIATVSAVLGVSATAYMGMRFRYINNLNKFAKNLKPNSELGEVLSGKTITFTMGGFVGTGRTSKASETIASSISNNLTDIQKIKHNIIPIDHNYTPSYKYKNRIGGKKKSIEFFYNSLKQLGKTFVKGENKEAHNIAEVIYSYANKNPGKSINLVGHSGGGVLSREVNYILRKKGINTKMITYGSPDFQLLPRKGSNELNFVSNKDFVKPISAPNKIMFDTKEDGHRQVTYFKNKEVVGTSLKFLYG